jgi:hypothetical protein
MHSPFGHSLNHILHNHPCPIIISSRDKIILYLRCEFPVHRYANALRMLLIQTAQSSQQQTHLKNINICRVEDIL